MRSEFPEYCRWQNAIRPEDTGDREGRQGIPACADEFSQFERKIEDALSSRLGVVQNNFVEEESRLHAEYRTVEEHLRLTAERYLSKRASLGRDPDVRVAPPLAVGATACICLLLAFPIAYLLPRGDSGVNFALILALLLASLLSCGAFAAGVIMRQGPRPVGVRLGAALLALVGISVIALAVAAPLGPERFPVALAGAAGLLAVATLAFYSRDPDPDYPKVAREYLALHARKVNIRSQRIENRHYHRNIAERHVELARQMISIYRQSNCLSRSDGDQTPKFFAGQPGLKCLGIDDFALFGSND